jgi:hypothetical protein
MRPGPARSWGNAADRAGLNARARGQVPGRHTGDDAIRARLAEDPWIRDGTLTVTGIERWTILLDGRC